MLYISLTDVLGKISEQLDDEAAMGRLFAIVHIYKQQRKVTMNDIVLFIKPIEASIGDRIRLNKVNMRLY